MLIYMYTYIIIIEKLFIVSKIEKKVRKFVKLSNCVLYVTTVTTNY